MTPELLREAGAAMYGPRWQSEVARLVERPQQHVAEWVAGKRAIPADVAIILSLALDTHVLTVRDVAKKVRKAVDRTAETV